MKMRSVFILPLLMAACDAARILVLMPFPGRSHWIVYEPLFQELAARGHQVTVFSSFPQKKPLANYTDVDFSQKLPPMLNQLTLDFITKEIGSPWITTHFLNDFHEDICRKVLDEPQFQDLLKKRGQYDLIFTEVCGNDCFSYFAHKLNIPLISFTTSMMMPWAAERVGLPDNPSYIPNYLVTFSPEMNLWQRTYNTLVLVYSKFWHQWVYSKKTQAFVEEYFHEPVPPVHEVVSNMSLMFVNSYHATSQSRPFPPNVIEVGGIHIKKRQPLSKEFQTIYDNAKNGVIVMSFGSFVRVSTLSKSVISAFMNAFAKIPQTVIFKFEEDLPEAPPNVIIKKWIPQGDLTDHEKVVAVIVHGGQASTMEAVHFGKPLIGVPFCADQHNNIEAVVKRGAGIKLNVHELTQEKIETAVFEIVNNPKYTENMKRLSLQFRDRPMTPLQTAVYWTEYVIRHQGAPHLRPASVSLPLYQYLLLDVIALLLLSIAALIAALYFIGKRVLSALPLTISKQSQSESSKKDD